MQGETGPQHHPEYPDAQGRAHPPDNKNLGAIYAPAWLGSLRSYRHLKPIVWKAVVLGSLTPF